MPLRLGTAHKLVERLVTVFLAYKQEVSALSQNRRAHGLRTEQRIAQIDGPQLAHTPAVPFQPPFGGVAFAVLLLGTVLRSDELGHQRQHAVVPGSHQSRSQQRVIVLGLAVGTFAGQSSRASRCKSIRCHRERSAAARRAAQSFAGRRVAASAPTCARSTARAVRAAPGRADRECDCRWGSSRCQTTSCSWRRCVHAPCATDALKRTRSA